MSLYDDLLAAGVPLSNHESDLYFKATPEAWKIYNDARREGLRMRATTFTSNTNGTPELWAEVPFAFDPFWRNAAQGGAR